MRILRIYSLNNFYGKGIHKIVLILFIMLYITSLILVFLVTRSFYLLTIFIQFFLLYLLPVINSNLISFSICLFVEVQFTYNTMLVPGHSDWIYLYTPLQYSCLENPMDGGAWQAAVHGVAEGWTRLSDFTFTFHFHGLEKEMATYSSVLAWRIPGMGEPGGLLSMGSHRVGHD